MLTKSDFPLLTDAQVQEALARWNEPHRAWHAMSHLTQLLSNVSEQAAHVSEEDRAFLRYLALFHDVVYEPLSATNEEDSAELAGTYLRDYPRVEELKSAILATKKHVAHTELERLFNGWDCAILHETSIEKLDAYETAIQFEYSVVEPDIYRRERAKFLHQASIDYANPALAELAKRVEDK